jgi:hypothetical protein
MGCNPLTDRASSVNDPPHNVAEGLACSFVANQTVKVPQVLCKWRLSRDFLPHNKTLLRMACLHYTIPLPEYL